MMKSRVLLLLSFMVFATGIFSQSSSQNASVLVSATVQNSPPRITLNWASASGTSSISIYRKLKTDSSWGSSIANPSASSTQYQDNSVQVGVAYEYKIVRSANGTTGTGYIASGIEVPLPDYRGKVILLVDNTLAPQMTSELDQLQKDLKGDGWAVIREDVSRTASASSIRNIVVGHYNNDPSNVKAVYIVGHVPVPYSGNAAPDGHSEHVGAWPCDGYYGEMNGSWTDNSVNNNGAQRQANRNIPGDGKFDQSNFPSDVELQVGRVDLYEMPAFSQGEVQLVKNYLNRAHSFKVKGWSPLMRGIVFDNLQWVGSPIAGSAWRNMGPLVGASNITDANENGTSFHNLVNGESYLWTYSSGGGTQGWVGGGPTFNGANNVGTTNNYASNSTMGGVFNMSCGSYFGDWDNMDNFLRAPIAKGDALTSVWAGIPAWYFHHMGLGDNIGYSTKLTMNNSSLYTPLTEGWQGSIGRVHLGLMGDPTLRMQMIAPPTSLTVSNSNGIAAFSWNASPESNILGYHIYRFSSNGSITRLTTSPVSGTSYQNAAIPFEAGREYMVRAVKLQVNQSGSYLNLSLGAIATAAGSASADCAGVVGGSAVPGSPCNDNDPCTTNDTWNSNCQCVGTPGSISASITPQGPTSFCSGGSVVLSANTGSGYSYTWKRDGTTISGANGSNYTATQAGTYTVRISNGGCETTSSGVTVSIGSAPSASITPQGPTSFCAGGSVVLSANTGSGYSYTWKRDGTTISGANGSNYTATQAGTYTVRISNGGCETTSSGVTVSIGSAPSASITPQGPTSFCAGGSVVLSANTGSGYSYTWKRDGTTISGANGSNYTATQAGTYTVRISNGGCETTSSGVTVSIGSAPSASITPQGPTSFCSGGSVVLSANTGSGYSYTWKRDGTTISGANGSNYTATQAGTYTVRISNGGCETTSSGVTVSIGSAPSASITPQGPTSFCSGGSVVLSANTGSGYSYTWKRDGTTISGANGSNYTATQAGTYTVRISNGGCETTSSGVTVSIAPTPTATINSSGGTDFCEGGSVVLNANTGSGFTYTWKRNGTTISGANGSSYTATISGSYTVTIGSGNCSATSAPMSVNVSTGPVASIGAAGSTTICEGSTVLLNATSGAGLTYSWQLNGQVINGANGSSYAAGQPGNYSVTVTGNGCSATSSTLQVTSFVPDAPELTLNGASTVCAGETVTISTDVVDGAVYTWTLNGTELPVNGASIVATEGGVYGLQVSTGDCVSAIATTEVTVLELPGIAIGTHGPTMVCTGDTVVLNATVDPAYAYMWMLDGQLIPGAADSTYAATIAGEYTVYVSNGVCSNTSAPVEVSMTPDVNVFTSGPTDICEGDSVFITAVADSAYNYTWTLNGTILEDTTASISAMASGAYVVTIEHGSCTASSAPIEVIANAIPVAEIIADGPLMFCAGDSVQLSTLADTAWTYQWSLDGIGIEGATANALTATIGGIYGVAVSIGGCTIGSAEIEVTTLPVVSLELDGPAAFCTGDSVTISAIADTTYNYAWSMDGVTIDGADQSSITVSTAGAYQVSISDGTCSATSEVIDVITNDEPIFTMNTIGEPVFCAGDSVLLVVAGDDGSTYEIGWSLNGAAIAEGDSLYAYSSGVYIAAVNNGGCVVSDTAEVVTTLPIIDLMLQGDSSFCEGSSVVLHTPFESTYSYQWMLDGEALLDETAHELLVSSSGTYSVSVEGNGCSAVSGTIALEVTTPPETDCYADAALGIVGVEVLNGEGPFTYMWNGNAELDSTILAVEGAGIHVITVTDRNGCSETCTVTITNENEDDCLGLRTEEQAYWTEAVLAANDFSAAFPNGLAIGCGFRRLILTDAGAVDAFLPSNGPSQRLPFGQTTDPGGNYGNSLAGELVALKLAVRFDELAAGFANAETLLKDAVIAEGIFSGFTVAELIEEADRKIGGCFSWFSRNQLRIAIEAINTGYVGGTMASGYLECPQQSDQPDPPSPPVVSEQKEESKFGTTTTAYPNPFTEHTTIVVGELQHDDHLVIDILSADGVLLERVFDGRVPARTETKVIWNGSSRAMGVYFYRVSSTKEVFTGRLVRQ